MRNRYPGKCYNCGKNVKAGDGFFERRGGRWWVKHDVCSAPKRKKIEKEKIMEATRFIHDQQKEITEKVEKLNSLESA